MNNVMYSSNSDTWSTPNDIFNMLDNEFHFDLDPCANEENHKCEKYFTISENGLLQSWGGYCVFCNPPYGRKIGEWVKKAYLTHEKYHNTIVLLLPARTDTKWFHNYIYNRAEVRFLCGRLKFGNSKENAPFPSMVVVFKK